MELPPPLPEMMSSFYQVESPKDCAVCAPAVENIPDISAKYQKVERIGKGTYGVVFLAKDKDTDEKVVIKKSLKSSEDDNIPSDFIREVSALSALKGHPDIIELKGLSFSNSKRFIILEAAKDDLSKDIQKNAANYGADSTTTKRAMYEIIRGMKYMNDLGLIHRDLKPQNILVMPDGNYKITDFGLARGGPFHYVTKQSGAVFTVWYRPPEILQQQIYRRANAYKYDTAADVWSVGVVFWDMLAAGTKSFGLLRTGDFKNQDITQLQRFMWALGGESFKYSDGMCAGLGEDMCKTFFKNKMADFHSADYPDPFTRTVEQARASTLKSIGLARDSDAADLLFRLLDPNPDARISFEAALAHPYFDQVRDVIAIDNPDSGVPSPEQILMDRKISALCPAEAYYPGTITLPKHFTILTQWLYDVTLSLRMTIGTYFLTVHIFRCFIARRAINSSGDIQCYGVAAMYLASQYYEISQPDLKEYSFWTNHTCSTGSILEKAVEMLEVVGAQMHLATSFVFLVEELKDRKDMQEPTNVYSRRRKLTPGLILAGLEILNNGETGNLSPYELAQKAIRMYDEQDVSEIRDKVGSLKKESPFVELLTKLPSTQPFELPSTQWYEHY
jgi:serine/threonine protein kinase